MATLLTVIPARGGSKRIPEKNIHPLGGKPLLSHTLEQALAAGLRDNLVVSTDSDSVTRVAASFGVKVIDRPKELALDDTSTEDVLLHALSQMEKSYDWIMTLPPTSPFRKAETIQRFIREFEYLQHHFDCLMSVTESTDDLWIRNSNSEFTRVFSSEPRRQQSRTPFYIENSAIYITRVDALKHTKSILGSRVTLLPIDRKEGWDINNKFDLELAEAILTSRLQE